MLLSKQWQGFAALALTAALVLAFATPAFAQRDTGIMVVRAVDPDGAPLPGVMVLARGPVGTQTQYTGIDGTARFPGLYPGTGYTATFTLDGFNTLIREGLEIRAQRTTSIEVTMQLATVEETITVTGESPVVDVKSTITQTNIEEEIFEAVPTGRNPWVMANMVPGMVSGAIDVGGNAGMQQYSLEIAGNANSQKSFSIDGLKTNVNFPGDSRSICL